MSSDYDIIGARVREEVKRGFRVLAAQQDTTMSDLARQYIERAVEEEAGDKVLEGSVMWWDRDDDDSKAVYVVKPDVPGESGALVVFCNDMQKHREFESGELFESGPTRRIKQEYWEMADDKDETNYNVLAAYYASADNLTRIR